MKHFIWFEWFHPLAARELNRIEQKPTPNQSNAVSICDYFANSILIALPLIMPPFGDAERRDYSLKYWYNWTQTH